MERALFFALVSQSTAPLRKEALTGLKPALISDDSVQIARPVEQARSCGIIAEGSAVVQDIVAEQAHARLKLRLKDMRRLVPI